MPAFLDNKHGAYLMPELPVAINDRATTGSGPWVPCACAALLVVGYIVANVSATTQLNSPTLHPQQVMGTRIPARIVMPAKLRNHATVLTHIDRFDSTGASGTKKENTTAIPPTQHYMGAALTLAGLLPLAALGVKCIMKAMSLGSPELLWMSIGATTGEMDQDQYVIPKGHDDFHRFQPLHAGAGLSLATKAQLDDPHVDMTAALREAKAAAQTHRSPRQSSRATPPGAAPQLHGTQRDQDAFVLPKKEAMHLFATLWPGHGLSLATKEQLDDPEVDLTRALVEAEALAADHKFEAAEGWHLETEMHCLATTGEMDQDQYVIPKGHDDFHRFQPLHAGAGLSLATKAQLDDPHVDMTAALREAKAAAQTHRSPRQSSRATPPGAGTHFHI